VIILAIVYAIKNKVTGKMYVGSSRQKGNNRWKAHLKSLKIGNHHSDKLQRSWNKHGEENFEYIILEQINENDDQFEREQIWIDKYNSFHKGYNAAPTATKISMSEETKEKIRNTMKGRPLTPEHIEAFSKAKIGEKRSKESKEKMRQSALGRKHSEETLKKISEGGKGRKMPDETKLRMSEAAKNRSVEHKQKISEGLKRKHNKNKISNLE
jgi:group I intron endonuclease